MPRARSQHVQTVKKRLLRLLGTGALRPGQRFLSNRAIASRYQISYQTADNLVRELVQEGCLERVPASGTYLPGGRTPSVGVLLMFHSRARRKNSFGSLLLELLIAQLDRQNIPWRMSWSSDLTGSRGIFPKERYPVIWQRPEIVERAVHMGRHALLLDHRPLPGLGSSLIDSVSVDNFSGGAAAAQHLRSRSPAAKSFAILAGPADDPQSCGRVQGFLSVEAAAVFHSPTWYYEGGLGVADKVLAAGKDGIFCCGDRLAEGIVRLCSKSGIKCPPLVGFDDAPIAGWLKITTMAVPWKEFIAAAVRVIEQRRIDNSSTAIAQVLSTKLVTRR